MTGGRWLDEEPTWADPPLVVSTADGRWRLGYGEIAGNGYDSWVLHDILHERSVVLDLPSVVRGEDLLAVLTSPTGPFEANELLSEVRLEGLPLAD